MAEINMTALVIKKLSRLGYEVESADDVTDAISEAAQSIMNFCHIAEIPDALVYAWRDMACGVFLNEKYSTGGLDAVYGISGAVSSIKEGDTQVNFSSASNVDDRIKKLIDSLLNGHRGELYHYRKLCNE